MASLFTIGYEGATIGTVVDALQAAGARLLIDVRAVPQSRKPGFSKRLLAGTLLEAGIGYAHLRGLGTPKPGRDAARRGNSATMQHIFRAHLATPEAQFDLARARTLVGEAACCLLCFERDPAQCHRALVAEALGGTVRHLAA